MFTPRVEVIDIRPLNSTVPGLVFVQDDATILGQFRDGSLESLSSLHAAERLASVATAIPSIPART